MALPSTRIRRSTLHRPRARRRQRGGIATAFSLAMLALGTREGDRREADERRPAPMVSTSWSFPLLRAACATPSAEKRRISDDEEEDGTPPPRPLNYYELLGLESPETHRRRSGALHNRKRRTGHRARITSDQIKKAYRRQAQLYHPDKATRRNMTKEEANSRFAEIAEAYQALSDPASRYEYDWELLDTEEEYEEERLWLEEERREARRERRKWENRYGDDGADPPSLYGKIRNGASNFEAWRDSLNLDPWAVFEDFFFRDSAAGYNDAEHHRHGHGFHQAQHQGPPSEHARTASPRVSETTVYRGYDPSFGAGVYTVLRREEYDHDVNEDEERYYRILGQDFISGTRVDPYTGFTTQEYFSALTEPYFVEEGYSKEQEPPRRDDAGAQYERGQAGQQTKAQMPKPRKCQNKLEQGESFTPNSSYAEGSAWDPWISPNGKYEAMISSTCELLVVDRNERQRRGPSSDVFGDDHRDEGYTLWSSETYIPNSRAHGCHLTLNSAGRLVLSVDYGSGLGSAAGGGDSAVLWNTPSPPVVPHLFDDAGDDQENVRWTAALRYYASLDDDGAVAIYRVRERVGDGAASSEPQSKTDSKSEEMPNDGGRYAQRPFFRKLGIRPMIDRLSVMYRRISETSTRRGQTRAALAWDHVRHSVRRLFLGRPWIASSTQERDQGALQSGHECVFSTSPAGCLTSGRNAIHITKTIAQTIQRSVQSVDSRLDEFLSSLSEPAPDYEYDSFNLDSGYPEFFHDEDDEDILDTLLRVTGAAGVRLGEAGIRAARMATRKGRAAAGRVVGKMKDGMGRHSARRWGQMMAGEEEVDRFF